MSKKAYRKLFLNTKQIYFTIGAITCPALGNAAVYFDRQGFQHLVRKGKRHRSSREIIRRFKLIPFAKNIIITTEKIHHYEKTKYLESIGEFWTLSGKIVGEHRDSTVYIVLRKLNTGRIHFFSIFNE